MKMNKTNKKMPLYILLGAVILFTAHFNAFPYICHNGSGSGYGNEGDGSSLTNPVEALVIEGAGYFLQANTDIQLLLKQVELKDIDGIDNPGSMRVVNNALENIIRTRKTYKRLIKTAKSTPYNPLVMDRLKHFAYDTFMMDNRMNPVTFKELASYLSRGDITGTFKRTHTGICAIEKLLTRIKQELLGNRLPGIPVFWELNERCAGTSLFGSYAARVFQEINNIKSK
jgi:hypothetical protein